MIQDLLAQPSQPAPTRETRRRHVEHEPAVGAFIRNPKTNVLELLGANPGAIGKMVQRLSGHSSLTAAGMSIVPTAGGVILIRRNWVPPVHMADPVWRLKALRLAAQNVLDAYRVANSLDEMESVVEALVDEMGASQ